MLRRRAYLGLVLAAGTLSACSLLADWDGFDPLSTLGAPDADLDSGRSDGSPEEVECILPTDAPQRGRTFYIAPNGNDANSGATRDLPVLTFSKAFGKLLPGDTLVLLDGEYGAASGPFVANCDNVSNGTPFDPIVVRAENERRAWVKSDGSRRTVVVTRCNHWNVDGLVVTSSDVATTSNVSLDVVALTNSTSVKFRRSIVGRTNRCAALPSGQTNNAIFVYQSSDILVEDNEVYDYHTNGISNYSDGTVMRGNYTNSRDWLTRSPPACAVSGSATGQFDVVAGGIFENAVSEGNDIGIRVGEDTVVRGSISINNGSGLFAQPTWRTLVNGAAIQDTLVALNNVGLRSEAWAFSLQGVTLFGNAQEAIRLANNGSSGVPPRNLFVKNSLFVKNGDFKFLTVDQWSFDQVNSFQNLPANFPVVEPIADNEGNIRSSQSTDPLIGSCIAYLPSSSPMRRGPDIGSIGADLRYRYRDGQVTCERYWDRATGRIRCGALVPGMNDDPNGSTVETRACINVHRRVNVTSGCPIP